MKFELNKWQLMVMNMWVMHIDEYLIKEQQKKVDFTSPFLNQYEDAWNKGKPFGGTEEDTRFTYEFTPDGENLIVNVFDSLSDNRLALSNIDERDADKIEKYVEEALAEKKDTHTITGKLDHSQKSQKSQMT